MHPHTRSFARISTEKLFETDLEIERTFRRKVRRDREQRFKEQTLSDPETMADGNNQEPPRTEDQAENTNMPRRMSLNDRNRLNPRGFRSCIVEPDLGPQNFELKPALIHMVQQDQFAGLPSKNPTYTSQSFRNYAILSWFKESRVR